MLSPRTNALYSVSLSLHSLGNTRRPTFCVSTALFNCAISSVLPIVPRNIGLNWFIPAFVNRRVGSLWGTTEDEGTREHHRLAGYSPEEQDNKIVSSPSFNWTSANAIRAPRKNLFPPAATPPRTYRVSFLLEVIQKLFPNHLSSPFCSRHIHSRARKIPIRDCSCCVVGSQNDQTARLGPWKYLVKVTQSAPTKSTTTQTIHPLRYPCRKCTRARIIRCVDQ